MTKKIRTLLAFSAIGISTAALPLSGAEFESVHVTVPFDFVAGKTALPAGDYTILETGTHAVMIRGNHGSVILLETAGDEVESDRTSLGFERTEKAVYLKSLRTAGKPISILRTASETEK